MSVGDRIKLRRKQLGISADLLAEKVGVSRSTVFRWEKGDIEKVPGDTLVPIAKALNVTPAYLMGWEELPDDSSLPFHIPSFSSSGFNPQEVQLINTFRTLNSLGQAEVLHFAQHLSETDSFKKSAGPGSLPAAK